MPTRILLQSTCLIYDTARLPAYCSTCIDGESIRFCYHITVVAHYPHHPSSRLWYSTQHRLDLVHAAQDTWDVLVDVDDTHVVGLFDCKAAQRDFWHVDCAGCGAKVDVVDQRVRDLDTNRGLRLFSRATNVRCEDDVLEVAKLFRPSVELVGELRAIPSGLVGVDVQCCTSKLAGLRGLDEGWNVHNRSARGIEKEAPAREACPSS
ncbi:hypothetical protein KC351_g25 [Hortaea werneckii]|nr:hypothetical protein KC351_g25 [Hortaea werneckii]